MFRRFQKFPRFSGGLAALARAIGLLNASADGVRRDAGDVLPDNGGANTSKPSVENPSIKDVS